MPSDERWVPTLAYEVVRLGSGDYRLCRRGRKHVREAVPDHEIVLVPIAQYDSYDEAIEGLRAMRATIEAPE